jgi:hypothetical protein
LQLASAKTKPAPRTPVAIDRFFTLVPFPNTSAERIGSRTIEDHPPSSHDGNDLSRLPVLRSFRKQAIGDRVPPSRRGLRERHILDTLPRRIEQASRASKIVDLGAVLRYDGAAVLK